MIIETSASREVRIAYILRALEQMDTERAEFMTGWKDRRLRLENELASVCNDILTGQASLIDTFAEVTHSEPMSQENGR